MLLVVGVLAWSLLGWRTLAPPVVIPQLPLDVADMVHVPGGELEDGPLSGPVASFWIDRFEVTREEYEEFVASTGHPPPLSLPEGEGPGPAWSGDLPVTGVDLEDAQAYATWRGRRLPTAAEWTFAARGPLGVRFPWGDAYQTYMANTKELLLGRPTPVGLFEGGRSPVGVYDLVGNVKEWTATREGFHVKDRYLVLGGSFLDATIDRQSRETVLDPYTYLPSRGWILRSELLLGPRTAAGNLGFRCALDAAVVKRHLRIAGEVARLGHRDPVGLVFETWPAEDRLRAEGRPAVPALEYAAAGLPPGSVRDRILRLAWEIEAAAGGS